MLAWAGAEPLTPERPTPEATPGGVPPFVRTTMPAHHLLLDGIAFAYPDRTVFTDVSLTAPPDERVALVGENGVGKSTLLRIAAGELEPDSGTIERPARTEMLWQELPYPAHATLDDVLADAVAPVREIVHSLEAAASALGEDPGAERDYADALTAAELAEAWSLDARIHTTLAGLGLGDVERCRQLGRLSGGQRSRLALAAILLRHPTLLLLDEPTNHLDDDATVFLVAELQAWRGPVLIASHDRAFLDDVGTRIVDLDPAAGPFDSPRQGTVYTGSFTDYLEQREIDRERWARQYRDEQAELKRLRHVVNVSAREVFHTDRPKTESRIASKFYSDKAAKTVGRRVRDARTQLGRLQREQVAKPHDPLSFAGFASRRHTPENETVLSLQRVSVAGRLGEISLDVTGCGRWLITGANGSGKSTLLQVIDSTLEPTTGSRLARPGLRVGRLAQDLAWPNLELSPRQILDALGLEIGALGLVHPRDLNRRLGDLSLGTQRRFALALLVANPPDVLLLDEPTNHLSLSLAEELEDALGDYPGAVVIASHDRWLRRRWTGQVLRIFSIDLPLAETL